MNRLEETNVDLMAENLASSLMISLEARRRNIQGGTPEFTQLCKNESVRCMVMVREIFNKLTWEEQIEYCIKYKPGERIIGLLDNEQLSACKILS